MWQFQYLLCNKWYDLFKSKSLECGEKRIKKCKLKIVYQAFKI